MKQDFIPPELLGDKCSITEKANIKYVFSDKELNLLREELYELNLFIYNRSRIIQEVKEIEKIVIDEESFKEMISAISTANVGDKPLSTLKKETGPLIQKIETGSELIETTLYGFADHEEETMNFYKPDGNFYSSRPLYPHERQGKLFNLSTKAS